MKNALVTLAIGDSEMWEWTHPLMEKYASRIQADFIVLKGNYENVAQARSQKFRMYELFEQYDRLLYVDGDVAIHPGCENLFDIVPYESIGAVGEKPPFSEGRNEVLKEACGYYGIDFTPEAEAQSIWYNTGLIVISRIHRKLFAKPKKEIRRFGEGWVDMPLMNALLVKYGFPVMDLGLKFNYMGSLVSHKCRPFEPVEASVFHATGFLRIYRMEFLKTIIKFWLDDTLPQREKISAYQKNLLVRSYFLYESIRSATAKRVRPALQNLTKTKRQLQSIWYGIKCKQWDTLY